MRVIGLLGGTFDPFHNGHLQLAQTIHTHLQLEDIRLIPSAQPLLRTPPIANAEQRLEMLYIATENHPWLKVDDREIKRGGFSYTVETLTQIRAETPHAALCFIMSMDQFLQFDQWKSWEDIPKLAHMIIANRPGYEPTFNERLQALLHQRQTDEPHLLHSTQAGLIFFQDISPLSISGTEIRARLKAGENVEGMVPQKIRRYIDQQKLYV